MAGIGRLHGAQQEHATGDPAEESGAAGRGTDSDAREAGDRRTRETVGAARLSVASNLVLVVAKLVVGWATGSVSVVAEALHSGNDLLAAAIALGAVRQASKPPDLDHPYGHGKFESLSGAVEAGLIAAAAAGIVWTSVKRLRGGGEIESVGAGLAVMAVSAIMNTLVSAHLLRVAKRHQSIALEADGWHLRTDVYTSLGVLAGLALVGITGVKLLDPIAALVVAGVILHAAYSLTRKAVRQLLDSPVDPQIETLIANIVHTHSGQFVEAHKLRTRRAGAEIHVDLHLVVCPDMHVSLAHDLASHIEDDIHAQVPGATAMIHIEGPEPGWAPPAAGGEPPFCVRDCDAATDDGCPRARRP